MRCWSRKRSKVSQGSSDSDLVHASAPSLPELIWRGHGDLLHDQGIDTILGSISSSQKTHVTQRLRRRRADEPRTEWKAVPALGITPDKGWASSCRSLLDEEDGSEGRE